MKTYDNILTLVRWRASKEAKTNRYCFIVPVYLYEDCIGHLRVNTGLVEELSFDTIKRCCSRLSHVYNRFLYFYVTNETVKPFYCVLVNSDFERYVRRFWNITLRLIDVFNQDEVLFYEIGKPLFRIISDVTESGVENYLDWMEEVYDAITSNDLRKTIQLIHNKWKK